MNGTLSFGEDTQKRREATSVARDEINTPTPIV